MRAFRACGAALPRGSAVLQMRGLAAKSKPKVAAAESSGEARNIAFMKKVPSWPYAISSTSPRSRPARPRPSRGGADARIRCQVMQYGKNIPGSELPQELRERAGKLAKAYSRAMMREHHATTGAIQRKLDRQQAAIAALPEPLRRQALEVRAVGIAVVFICRLFY